MNSYYFHTSATINTKNPNVSNLKLGGILVLLPNKIYRRIHISIPTQVSDFVQETFDVNYMFQLINEHLDHINITNLNNIINLLGKNNTFILINKNNEVIIDNLITSGYGKPTIIPNYAINNIHFYIDLEENKLYIWSKNNDWRIIGETLISNSEPIAKFEIIQNDFIVLASAKNSSNTQENSKLLYQWEITPNNDIIINTISDTDVEIIFNKSDIYTIKLIVINENNRISTKERTIMIDKINNINHLEDINIIGIDINEELRKVWH